LDVSLLLTVNRAMSAIQGSQSDEFIPALKALQTAKCHFRNLPEERASRWGESLTAEKMTQCRWVTPKLVCQVAFVEWTGAGHLRHCTFVARRDDKRPAEVVREA
jgi:ATP-dependent DNA ligase